MALTPVAPGYINEASDTEFGQKQEALAEFLYKLCNGDPWAQADDSYHVNYRADAAEVLLSQPHLLRLDERERLVAKGYPEVAL